LENGWKLIDSALLSQPVQKSVLKRGNPLESPVQILLRFIPPAVWNILVTAVNRNLSSNQSSLSKKRYSLKMATMEQSIQFYGLVIQIENSYGNDTRNLREHYKNIKLQFGEIRGMGLDRFETLWRTFNPSIEEIQQICDILHETFNNYLEHVEICVVDESVIGYQPGSKTKKEAESR
jgi:hypothetical protein